MDDGREIAVKKLSQFSRQGKREFATEAKLLARVQHRNVVNLLGYCVHGQQEKLLVYEYVAHESLDKILFSKFNSFTKHLCLNRTPKLDILLNYMICSEPFFCLA